jgi:hypothetical protein
MPGVAVPLAVIQTSPVMNRFLCRFAAVLAVLVLAGGCRKKDVEEEVADEAEKALPATEQVTPAEPARPAPGDAIAGNSDFEAWFKKHHLDLNDPKMLDADPDGDGFSNRDEFLADTDPHDPNSFPGIHKLIRLKEFTEVRLPLMVESVEGDKARIRRTDGGEDKAETVKAGDAIKGLPLKVERVEQINDTDKEGKPIDRSLVVLEDSGTKERLTLVKDMPARTAASFAMLASADGNTTIKVKQGDTFKWPGDDTASYKVIDLREDQVVLQQLENKKMWTVTRAEKAPAAPGAPK